MHRMPSAFPAAPLAAAALPRRRELLWGAASLTLLGLGGCGFKLRGTQTLPFQSAQLVADMRNPVAAALATALQGSGVRLVESPADVRAGDRHVVITLSNQQRERAVTGQTATGQVRELQLRSRATVQVEAGNGRILQDRAEVLVQRDISYNEADALAKQGEENLLFNDMSNDLVRQLLRRLSAVVLP